MKLHTNRPHGGVARSVWDWFTSNPIRSTTKYGVPFTLKLKGTPPDTLQMIRPGHWQRAAGAAEVCIEYMGYTFYVHSVKHSLSKPLVSVQSGFDYRVFYL